MPLIAHTIHVLWDVPPLEFSAQHFSCKQEEEKGRLRCSAPVEALILAWCCWPLRHGAAASRRARHVPLYLVPRRSIWWGHAARSAAPETKAWLLQTQPQITPFFIHLQTLKRGKEEVRAVRCSWWNTTGAGSASFVSTRHPQRVFGQITK